MTNRQPQRRIRLDAVLRDVPCVLLTATGSTGAELRALDAGADTFIRKEEDLQVILAKLDAVLRRSQPRGLTDDGTLSGLGPKKILAVDDSQTYLGELSDALKGEGYRIVLVNSNPATIMTDPGVADATYVEPITPEIVAKIIEKERPDALLPTMGGQTALNTALSLNKMGVLDRFNVKMIGATAHAVLAARRTAPDDIPFVPGRPAQAAH